MLQVATISMFNIKNILSAPTDHKGQIPQHSHHLSNSLASENNFMQKVKERKRERTINQSTLFNFPPFKMNLFRIKSGNFFWLLPSTFFSKWILKISISKLWLGEIVFRTRIRNWLKTTQLFGNFDFCLQMQKCFYLCFTFKGCFTWQEVKCQKPLRILNSKHV